MSSSKKTSYSKESTSQVDPYGAAAPGINLGMGMATSYLQDPNSQGVFQGDRVADLSGVTRQGMAGLAGNTGYGQAQDYYQQALSGSGINPYLEGVQQSVMDRVMPGINATFAKSGMAGSTIHQNQLMSGLTSAISPYMFNAYETERGRQERAAQALPALLRQQSLDQLQSGSIDDQQRQNEINAAMAQFEQERTAGIRPVSEALPYLLQGGQAFGTQNTSETGQSKTKGSAMDTIMGGAMMALGAMTGNPLAAMGGVSQTASAAAVPGMMTSAPSGFTTGQVPQIAPTQLPAMYQYPQQGSLSYGNIGTYY